MPRRPAPAAHSSARAVELAALVPSQGHLGADRRAGKITPKKCRAQAHRPRVYTPKSPPSYLSANIHAGLSYLCPQCPACCAQNPGGCWWHLRDQGDPSCPEERPKGCKTDRGRRVRTGPGGSGPACPDCGGMAAVVASPGGGGQGGKDRAGVVQRAWHGEGGVSTLPTLTAGPHMAPGIRFSVYRMGGGIC